MRFCHESAKGRIAKRCACHEKTTRLHSHASKMGSSATQNAKTTSHLETAPKRAFRARLPLFNTLWRKWLCRSVRARRPAEKLRRVDEGPTTIRPRSSMAIRRGPDDQHDANTGPTPDSNYKREPFATPSGKNLSYHAMMFDEGFIDSNPCCWCHAGDDGILKPHRFAG